VTHDAPGDSRTPHARGHGPTQENLLRHAHPETSSVPTLRRRAAVITAAAGLVLASAVGTASAKEVTSGGTPVPTGPCNPVSSLTYKGDATTSDTGAASIQISYGVKPCDKSQVVTVDTQLFRNGNPAEVHYDDTAAPLSGRFTVFGVTANTSYIAKVTVYDAATGAVLGSKQIFAAAVYKGV
jgi:hypothetical protein